MEALVCIYVPKFNESIFTGNPEPFSRLEIFFTVLQSDGSIIPEKKLPKPWKDSEGAICR